MSAELNPPSAETTLPLRRFVQRVLARTRSGGAADRDEIRAVIERVVQRDRPRTGASDGSNGPQGGGG